VVDSTGLITAKKAKAAPVLIVARLASAKDAMTNYDTAYVVVTSGVNPPASFEIAAGRSTYGIGFDTVLKARMTDADGNPLTGVKVSYWSSDPGVASIDSGGIFQPKKEGTVKIAASTISYGVAYTDTLELTIGPPEVFEISLVAGTNAFAAFDPAEITIKAGQGIAWNSSLGTGAKFGNVTFDSLVANIGPSPVDGSTGNIPPFILKKHIRMFPIPGTYTYSNTFNGDKGKIIVVP
jgi:plastocyanin